jgi:hypothetical protein
VRLLLNRERVITNTNIRERINDAKIRLLTITVPENTRPYFQTFGNILTRRDISLGVGTSGCPPRSYQVNDLPLCVAVAVNVDLSRG